MDLSKLTTGGKISAGAGVALIVGLFLPWYGVDFGSFGSAKANAFDAGFLAWFGSFCAIAGAVFVVLKALEVADIKLGSLAAEQLGFVLAAIGAVLILLKLIVDNDFLKFGIFWSLIAAAVSTFGALTAMKEKGINIPKADDFKSIKGDD